MIALVVFAHKYGHLFRGSSRGLCVGDSNTHPEQICRKLFSFQVAVSANQTINVTKGTANSSYFVLFLYLLEFVLTKQIY